jgi:hypothetical protein
MAKALTFISWQRGGGDGANFSGEQRDFFYLFISHAYMEKFEYKHKQCQPAAENYKELTTGHAENIHHTTSFMDREKIYAKSM